MRSLPGLFYCYRTAASSGRKAPLAMLCLPYFSLLTRRVVCVFFWPPPCSSRASHSSWVATYPWSSEKNLWRKTVLILSRACVLYHPSRSCTNSSSYQCQYKISTYITCLSQVLFFLDHLFQHWILDITQLECSRLFRDGDSIKNMRPPKNTYQIS